MAGFIDCPCSRVGCPNRAHWIPCAELRAAPHDAPYEVTLGVALCSTCRDLSSISSFINDEEWGKLLVILRQLQRPIPDRLLSRISWRPIDAPEIRGLVRIAR